jgi:hypothetical protein
MEISSLQGVDRIIYDVDILCALKNVYDVPWHRYYVETELVPSHLTDYCIVWDEVENGVYDIVYKEFRGNGLVEVRRFRCEFSWADMDEGCFSHLYKIDGKEVMFDSSLEGKDPVYDWVMEHVSKDRKHMKYTE